MRKLTATLCLTIAVLLGSVGVCFALPPCPSDQNQHYHNCFGTYTWASGNKYVGEYKNNKRHGQGTFTYAKSGNKYVGEYRDSKRHGHGTFTFAHGSKYVGEFRNGKSHGQGTYTYAGGKIIEGIWKDNKFQYANKNIPKTSLNKEKAAAAAEEAKREAEKRARIAKKRAAVRTAELQKRRNANKASLQIRKRVQVSRLQTNYKTIEQTFPYETGVKIRKSSYARRERREMSRLMMQSASNIGNRAGNNNEKNETKAALISLYNYHKDYAQRPQNFSVEQLTSANDELEKAMSPLTNYIEKIAKKRAAEKRAAAKKRAADKRAAVKRAAAKKRTAEKKKRVAFWKTDRGKLQSAYGSYIIVKECHEKLGLAYIHSSELKKAKKYIRKIQKYYKSKDKKLNTDKAWDAAGAHYEKQLFPKMIKSITMQGIYDKNSRMICQSSLNDLTGFKAPGEKKSKRKKDF